MVPIKDPIRTGGPYQKLRFLSRVCAVLVWLTGFLVLIGWGLDQEFIKRIRPDAVPMNPVTAIVFMLAGSALLLLQEHASRKQQNVARVFAYLIILVGTLKLVSLLWNLPLPIDQILFRKKLWNPELQVYDSIAPNTAILCLLVGLAFLFINFESVQKRRPAQYISILITLLSLLSLYGYIYGITSLYAVKTHIPMAIHTGICFLLLGAGILFSRPDKGSMAIIIGENSGQIVFMRFIALVLPLLFGWTKIQAENAGIVSKEFGTALFAILTYCIAMFFLGRQSFLQHKIRETRRIAMDAIRENERKLQAILDHSATNISLKTPDGHYSLVNKQFEKDFKVSAATILGKTDYDLFPKELAEELNLFDKEIIRSGNPKTFEEKYLQQDGIHTYLTVKFPLLTQEQEIYALGAVSTDITKRKQLEDELRKSHHRLFGILDNLGEGVIVADSDGNLIIFNRRAEEIMGSGAASASWREWNHKFEFLRPDLVTPFELNQMPLFQAIKGQPSNNVEIFIRSENIPDGRWLAVTGRPVQNEKAEVIAGVIVFRDITLRKQLERLFSENEKHLNVILASIGEGIVMVNPEREVLLVNRKAEEILGPDLTKHPLEAWPATFGIYQASGEALVAPDAFPLLLALAGQETKNLEVLIRNQALPEGKNVYFSSRPIRDSKGNLSGAILDFKDITQQRKLEEHLREMQNQFQNMLLGQRPLL